MSKITVLADINNFQKVLDFINSELEKHNCSLDIKLQIAIAVEEIYVNIARYAYEDEKGNVTICFELRATPKTACIRMEDRGKQYNPLLRKDPDINLSAEDRQIGGLGIYMVKKSMDNVIYRYEGGKNIFIIEKAL